MIVSQTVDDLAPDRKWLCVAQQMIVSRAVAQIIATQSTQLQLACGMIYFKARTDILGSGISSISSVYSEQVFLYWNNGNLFVET